MTSPRPTVVFDWNGTLLEDVLCCLRATNTTLKHLGHAPVTLEHYREHCRVPIAHMYQSFGCNLEELKRRTVEIHELWNGVYNARAEKARLRRGARTMLKTLKKREHRVIILSNHTVENIAGHAKRFGIHEHFEAILAYERYGEAFTRHVKGERLKSYLSEHKIKEGVIVGDTEEEIDIARSHGLVSIAIKDGVCSTARLQAAKPDFLVGGLSEIPPIAERVFGRAQGGGR